jgi:hypothetical protein
LHGILKPHRSFCFANWPCFGLASRRKGKNSGLRLASKGGDVLRKHPQARLRVIFYNKSSMRAANQPAVFEFTLSVYILT